MWFPTQRTLSSSQDLYPGNDLNLTSLMSLDQSYVTASMLSRRIPGAPHRRHNFREKNLHRTRMTIKPLAHLFPARMILNLRASPCICGSYAIRRQV